MLIFILGRMSVKAKNFYRRALPSTCVDFASEEGKQLFKESLLEGNANIYFRLASQFRTQDEPAYCGLSTLGHFSPLAAYHSASDKVLIMDVARFKYPPHWVTLKQLQVAMCSLDKTTKRTRGYVMLNLRTDSMPLIAFALKANLGSNDADYVQVICENFQANNYRDSAELLSQACRTVCTEVRQTSIANVFSSSAVAALMLAWPFEVSIPKQL
ncbi:hypothetical protein ANCDUO_12475 [Ancylostoma duodenale]|uniref:glutathione gamma-glutamylcysteinyltransferase n=1 Tax=Ancylostoma duodenale TaxID=51022 RepID=A0A0C2G8N8_9BILA|nr:hypothetical protein ANCDUO_12475 [Ancylostoma duodenale]